MNSSDKPLRILMMLHMPWKRELGAARVQLELAEEFRAMGHHVEKFDIHDAFPRRPLCRVTELLRPQFFSSRAAAFVRRNGCQFDVIDANHGNLPLTKEELDFHGLLVARSNGLYVFYEEFDHVAATKWPEPRNWKSPFHIAIAKMARRRTGDFPLKSLQNADLITLLNNDEFRCAGEQLGLGQKCRVIPNGLSESRFETFESSRRPASERCAAKTVVFVGSWGARKGSKDWGQIIRRVRSDMADARFLLLGTGLKEESVLRDLNLPPCDWIRIVPAFQNSELPGMLSAATVGALPSYIEGFPFSVLEMLAAGLPTVAYDVPGPRAMLRNINAPLMTVPGDTGKFASVLVSLLKRDCDKYDALSEECRSLAGQFRWRNIAPETIGAYRDGLNRLAERSRVAIA